MINTIHDNQIRDTIVGFVSVLVMHDFIFRKIPAELLFYYKAMFHDISVASQGMLGSIQGDISAHHSFASAPICAGIRTESRKILSVWINKKLFIALFTKFLDLTAFPMRTSFARANTLMSILTTYIRTESRRLSAIWMNDKLFTAHFTYFIYDFMLRSIHNFILSYTIRHINRQATKWQFNQEIKL